MSSDISMMRTFLYLPRYCIAAISYVAEVRFMD